MAAGAAKRPVGDAENEREAAVTGVPSRPLSPSSSYSLPTKGAAPPPPKQAACTSASEPAYQGDARRPLYKKRSQIQTPPTRQLGLTGDGARGVGGGGDEIHSRAHVVRANSLLALEGVPTRGVVVGVRIIASPFLFLIYSQGRAWWVHLSQT